MTMLFRSVATIVALMSYCHFLFAGSQTTITFSNEAPLPFCEEVTCVVTWKNFGTTSTCYEYSLELPIEFQTLGEVLSTGSVCVAPGEVGSINFTFKIVPTDGKPGQYYGLTLQSHDLANAEFIRLERGLVSGGDALKEKNLGSVLHGHGQCKKQTVPLVSSKDLFVNTLIQKEELHFNLAPGANIVVQSGGVLEVKELHFHTCSHTEETIPLVVELGGALKVDEVYVNGNLISADELNKNSGLIYYYPNPCEDYLNAVVNIKDSERATFKILSATGIVLKTIMLTNGVLDVKDLTPGSYIIECQAGQSVYRHSFVKVNVY